MLVRFPEDREQDEVAGKHHAEHRAHEGEKEREKARHGVFLGHVIAGVEDDQESDRRNQRRKQPGKPVHAQLEVQPEFGDPGELEAEHAASGDKGVEGGRDEETNEGDRACEPGCGAALIGRKEDCDEASPERGENEDG
ncbi:hypothetical protein ABIA26_003205 [Sinorhizobium fredii]